MFRIVALAIVAFTVFTSCATKHPDMPYQAATKPERFEVKNDRLDVYPDEVRKNLAAYTNAQVAWAGIIVSTDAYDENEGNKIVADTVLEHHYFNWIQQGKGKHGKLTISPRGEGVFRTRWHMDKLDAESSFKNAEKFAGKGKLAIVYGTPVEVDTNGVLVLKYRYLRIFDKDQFTTNAVDYGRIGEPFHVIHH